jgi:chromosome segregation ATPase
MHSENLHVRVQYLEQKIRQLLERCKDQQEMLQQLQKENEQLIQQIANNREMVHGLLSNSLDLGAITKDEQRMRDWGARIDNYIGDIDKSIAYLEQL